MVKGKNDSGKKSKKVNAGNGKVSQSKSSYASMEYWDNRYKEEDFHRWYFSFDDLSPFFTPKVVNDYSDVLEIGCGDSPILTGFCSNPFHGRLDAIDFSPTVVQQMKQKYSEELESHATLRFLEMDARALVTEDKQYDLVMDKGTIDAMLCCSDTSDSMRNVLEIMGECVRVLRDTGVILIVSHMSCDGEEFQQVLQECIFPALSEKKDVQWHIDAHSPADEVDEDEGSTTTTMTDSSYPTVYMIHSRPRKVTRSLSNGQPALVTMKVMSYDS